MSTTKTRSAVSGVEANLKSSVRHRWASRQSSAQYLDSGAEPMQEEKKIFKSTFGFAGGILK
jgi:hypothetical protein